MEKEAEPRGVQRQRLFVDIDGTIAVFKPTERLETLYERNYFRDLEPQANVLDAIKGISRDNPEIELYILSAVLSDSEFALKEKNEWLDEHLPEIDREHRIFPPCGRDKKEYIPGGARWTDFLLDDYTHNLSLWEPPAKGIKLLNGINNTKGIWKRAMVSHKSPPGEIAKSITHIMAKERNIKEDLTQIKQFIQRANDEMDRDKSIYCRHVLDTEGMQPLTLEEAKEAMSLGITINCVENWEDYHGTWSGFHYTYPLRDAGKLHQIYGSMQKDVYSQTFINPEYDLANKGMSLILKRIIEDSRQGIYKKGPDDESRKDNLVKKEKKVKPRGR